MHDSLPEELRAVRLSHEKSQAKVARCMGIKTVKYRHWETGYRPLPDYRDGLLDILATFLDCCDATPEERKRIVELLTAPIVDEFRKLLGD